MAAGRRTLGLVLNRLLPGFVKIPNRTSCSRPHTIRCIFLYTGRKAIRPALHRPATYFYPYGAARPDVGSVAEIKPQLVELGAKYLIIDPLDGYAERQATLQLMDDIVKAYGDQAQLVFTSSDGLHKVFRLDRSLKNLSQVRPGGVEKRKAPVACCDRRFSRSDRLIGFR